MLTNRQQEILDFIRGFYRAWDMSPSCEEIRQHFGFGSPATVSGHLDLLEKKGVIYREKGCDRNIRLAEPVRRPRLLEIPYLGWIPAGLPVDQVEQNDEWLTLDADVLGVSGNARLFSLKIQGDSMIGAGIYNGDTVILEATQARHGNIVAALLDGATTLKRLVVEKGRTFLKAENPRFPDLIPVNELVIQGVFRGVISTNQERA